MSDETTMLERAAALVDAPEHVMDGLIRRRDRKRRNQRLAAGALALIVALAATGLVLRAFGAGRKEQPANPVPVHPGSIAFVGRKSGPGTGLFVFDPSTRRTSILVDFRCSNDPAGVRSCPPERINGVDWSPDGTRIAYSVQSDRCCYGDTEPTWAPAKVADGIYVLDPPDGTDPASGLWR